MAVSQELCGDLAADRAPGAEHLDAKQTSDLVPGWRTTLAVRERGSMHEVPHARTAGPQPWLSSSTGRTPPLEWILRKCGPGTRGERRSYAPPAVPGR